MSGERKMTEEETARAMEIVAAFCGHTIYETPCPIGINDQPWFKRVCDMGAARAMLEADLAAEKAEVVRIHHEKVDHYEARLAAERERDELRAALEALQQKINTPQIGEFFEAVRLEAAHQVERWGEEHDAAKSPEDWLWTIAYLVTKATQAARYQDQPKYLHHIVTTAAALANWHARAALTAKGAANG